MRPTLAILWLCLLTCGCSELPVAMHQPQFHNPYPQLSRVAVLPFFNQSNEPTLNGFAIANAYRAELQQIPGFEVMPVGVVEQFLRAYQFKLNEATDFQRLARMLNVDVVVVGSVTDFKEFYPPRMGLAVNWYAANPCFHPIPPGYGLPWGTAEEEFIPDALVREADFALAREQFQSVTPTLPELQSETFPSPNDPQPQRNTNPLRNSSPEDLPAPDQRNATQERPANYAVPVEETPPCAPQNRPVIEQVRQYDGHNAQFTAQLKNYYRFRDDERFGGWQSYLQRKDDFIRFCCYLHITEMLAARGGGGETRVVWQWPNDRYDH